MNFGQVNMSSDKLQEIIQTGKKYQGGKAIKDLLFYSKRLNISQAARDGNLQMLKNELDPMPQEDVLRRLVSDVETDGSTPLVLSCRNGHKDVAEYLLKKCCVPVEQLGKASITIYRDTVVEAQPLWFAAAAGHLDIVKLLLSFGARNNVGAFEMTPLLVASVQGRLHIVEHLISHRELVSKQERIDALELLGATFIDKHQQDLQVALKLWKRAFEERYEDGILVIPKVLDKPPISAYDNMIEFGTVMELEQMIQEPHSMQMQALLVIERILGLTNPQTVNIIMWRGFRYAYAHRAMSVSSIKICVTLWIYAIDIVQKYHKPLSMLSWESFCDIIELFDIKITDDGGLASENFGDIMMVFERAVKEVRVGHVYIEAGGLQDKDILLLQDPIVIVLYLVWILTTLMPNLEEEEVYKVKQAVHEFLMIGAKGHGGASPLHLACSQDSDSLYPNVKFSPHLPTVNLLLECGAPVDARDNDGNTALHRAASNKPVNAGVIQSLLKYGAHFDSCNKDQKTFYDLLVEDKPLYEITNSAIPFSLKCLAARVVRKHDMELNSLPARLQAFVLNH